MSELEAASTQLTEASHRLAEVMYKQSAASSEATEAGEAPPPGSGEAEGEVIDAEYVDVEDKS